MIYNVYESTIHKTNIRMICSSDTSDSPIGILLLHCILCFMFTGGHTHNVYLSVNVPTWDYVLAMLMEHIFSEASTLENNNMG